mgnify:CR=1 FL=1
MAHRRLTTSRQTVRFAPECLVCGTRLEGMAGSLLRLVGIRRSAHNPNVCTRCGTHLEEGRILEITVLFADLSGFTSITEELGTQGIHSIVNPFLSRATEAVLKENGFVDKYIGDAIMAIFNAPIPLPDPPLAAFRAAQAIQEGMAVLSRDLGRELQATVGLAGGYARTGAVGTTGPREPNLLGDAVNRAARLQGRANPGEILVDARTYAGLSAQAPGVPEESLLLKGFQEPVACYRFGSGFRVAVHEQGSAARRSLLPLGTTAFALLGAPCAMAAALGPVAVVMGIGSVSVASATHLQIELFDMPWVRLPMLALALLGAVANLAAVFHARRIRRELPQGGLLPLSHQDRRRTRAAVALSALTLAIILAEQLAHRFVMQHPWP